MRAKPGERVCWAVAVGAHPHSLWEAGSNRRSRPASGRVHVSRAECDMWRYRSMASAILGHAHGKRVIKYVISCRTVFHAAFFGLTELQACSIACAAGALSKWKRGDRVHIFCSLCSGGRANRQRPEVARLHVCDVRALCSHCTGFGKKGAREICGRMRMGTENGCCQATVLPLHSAVYLSEPLKERPLSANYGGKIKKKSLYRSSLRLHSLQSRPLTARWISNPRLEGFA